MFVHHEEARTDNLTSGFHRTSGGSTRMMGPILHMM